MRPLQMFSLAAMVLAPGEAALASSCSEQITTIERRLDSAGAEAHRQGVAERCDIIQLAKGA